MSCSLATAIARYICIIYAVRALLMSSMKEEMTKFAQMKPLSPQGHRSVDYKTSKCEDRSWTSSSQQRWSVLGFTQYGSSCLWKGDDDLKNCQLLSMYVCSRICAAAKCTHVYRTSQQVAELRI